MSSLRSREGYLLVDNRCAGDGLFESATVTCAHCHAVVVLNPQRTRPRHYCASCDHYVCDTPACALECRNFNKHLDRVQDAAFAAEQASRGAILIHV
jgi:hypothetical protein